MNDGPLISKSHILQGSIEYHKAVRDHNLIATYKPPVTLPGKCAISRSRKPNIILLPGFGSVGKEWTLFKEALKPMGNMVAEAQVNVDLGNEALTDNLYQWLNEQSLLKKSKPLTLIGFSNGGLIGRRLLQKYGTMNVNKLIMIGTPNWGTSLAVYGKWFIDHPGLKDLMVGSVFLNNLNRNYTAVSDIPHHVIIGDAARDVEGVHFDGVVWEDSATLGYTLPYIRVETGEPLHLCPLNSAWHLNLTRKAWRKLGPSNDKAWPITLRYVRCFLMK